MMMAKSGGNAMNHTPGPWTIGKDNEGVVRFTKPGELPDGCIVMGRNREANCNLIAAAPDLLAALKDARSVVARYAEEAGPCDHAVNICVCGIKESLDQIDAAIAKAEGRA